MIRIFVQPKPKAAHREIKVEIDWSALTEADIRLLAQQKILDNFAAAVRRGLFEGREVPSEYTYAPVMFHSDPSVYTPSIPPSWKGEEAPKSKIANLEVLLASLSPEDLKALLS